jgi:DNA-binding CsgD family transcriptional regulator
MKYEWDEDRVREACIEGTKRERQALIECGHLQAEVKPAEPEKGPQSFPQRPPAKTEDVDIGTYLINDFSGRSKMAEVAKAVCKKHAISLAALCGDNRARDFVIARREFIYICYFMLGRSTSQIGGFLGRDHTTIVHHLQVVTGKREVKYFRADQCMAPM